jgi:hypothetical protein
MRRERGEALKMAIIGKRGKVLRKASEEGKPLIPKSVLTS